MKIARLNEIEPRPWKNGGGVTWEVAADADVPPQWRLSVALIDRSGRFSDYSGYDRTILGIDGGPVQLEIDGERLELRHGEPFAFPGEAEVDGILCGPPARDLNVMTLRGRFTHDVKIIAAPEDLVLSNGDLGFAFVARGWASGGPARCKSGECMIFDGSDLPARIEPESGAAVCVVRIRSLTEPIYTERLRLRRFTIDDIENMLLMVADPIVMEHYPTVLDRDGARQWLERVIAAYDKHGYSFFAVERRDDGSFAGQVGLLHWDDVDGRPDVEVAYMLARDQWGKGYAAEAARACRDWAFERLGVDRVVSFIAVENGASIAVAERNGMERLKRLDENRFKRPIFVYGIKKPQWERVSLRSS